MAAPLCSADIAPLRYYGPSRHQQRITRMPILKSLSSIPLPKSGNDPVQTRQTKFITKLEEQKLLLKDPNHARTAQRWTKVNVERQTTTKHVVMSIKFAAASATAS
jgi:hypothetical protein